MIHHFRPLPLLALVPALLVMAGCSPTLVKTTPALPPGFLEAPVPAGDLSSYLYVSQESPLTIPLERFGDLTRATVNPGFGTIPDPVEFSQLALAVGPALDSFGGTVVFAREPHAEMAEGLLSDHPEVTAWRNGAQVNLVRGTGGWADAMKVALQAGDASRFQDTYPDIWDLMHLLPEAPPARPVAAGFVRVNSDILDSIVARVGLDLGGLSQAFGAINVSDVVFAAYADDSLNLSEEIDKEYLRQAGVGAIFVARSSYPGFILSFFLNTFADRVGLEKGTLADGQEVLFRELADVHLVAKSLGNTIFLVLAPTREQAQALMTSVLKTQVGD